MLNLPIKDIMNDHPLKVKAGVRIRDVAHLLLRYRINGLLIVAADDEQKLVGVFTIHDLLHLMGDSFVKGKQKMRLLHDLGQRPVKDFLDKKVYTLQVTDNAAKAVALMHKKNVMTIPVFDGPKLVGVIGRHDIINIAFI